MHDTSDYYATEYQGYVMFELNHGPHHTTNIIFERGMLREMSLYFLQQIARGHLDPNDMVVPLDCDSDVFDLFAAHLQDNYDFNFIVRALVIQDTTHSITAEQLHDQDDMIDLCVRSIVFAEKYHLLEFKNRVFKILLRAPWVTGLTTLLVRKVFELVSANSPLRKLVVRMVLYIHCRHSRCVLDLGSMGMLEGFTDLYTKELDAAIEKATATMDFVAPIFWCETFGWLEIDTYKEEILQEAASAYRACLAR